MEKANILTVGETITVDIKKLGINGEGIGYHQQMAVFVPGAIAQENVTCEITATKPGFAIGKILEILKKSEKRVEPPCEYYAKCGGCQMQHIDYAEQLKSKRHLLLQSLRRYTDQNADKLDIRKTIGMKTTFGYRNKSQMPFANTNYGLSLGLYEVNSNHFVAVDECIVQDPVVNAINAQVLKILIERNLVANDHVNKEGVLLNLVTRYMKSSGSAQVTLVVTRKLPELPEIAADIMNRIPAVKSVFYSINSPKNLSMFGKAIELLQGAP
ncbi:MAG: 23S rRNA (uracil(1939)-C(5))-methyltransferase RlmD, partial [bacterium]